MITFLFPGQGAQYKGMGGSLFDEFPEYTKAADKILGYSIKQLCLEDPKQQLHLTQFTQPALYVVSALSYLKKIRDDKKPDYVAGHSLGEYNALFAAEVFDFETGLHLVEKRGALMSKAQGGAMAAVLGLEADKVSEFLTTNALNKISIANFNSYTQLVISGMKADVDQAQEIFQKTNKGTFIPLNVSGAFHSSHMETAQAEFKDFINEFTFNVPSVPVVANVNAEIYHPAVVQEFLANQMINPVLWTKTIEKLQSEGRMEFEEVGPGTILKNLLVKIQNHQ